MVKFDKHWCPKGCGKKVMFVMREVRRHERYFECLKCHQKFTKEELAIA
jgi:hypothetical protein